MTWTKTAQDRARDREVYRDPLYLKNRPVILARAASRCEQCGRRGRLQVDHRTPVSATGRPDHSLPNLWALCGPCHASKTGREARQTPRKPSDPAFDNNRPNTRW